MARWMMALLGLLLVGARAPEPDLRLDTDAAEAVLAMLDSQAAGQGISDAQWARLVASAGYRRLRERENAMSRPFSDAEFRAFVSSPELIGRRTALAETLTRWRAADLASAAARAAAYLPAGSRIKATIFPMIKPRPNSFVFDLENDPAIFLYLDPAVPPERFTNIVAHELHHIGFASACSGRSPRQLAPAAAAIEQWSSALGEGVAMLAAAGGPEVHPHASSPAEDRARWDGDVARFDSDFARLASFFSDIGEGRLTGDPLQRQAMSFFGVQGPWYTVGWRMAQLIEREFGREALVPALCNRHALFLVYNLAAARRSLPQWPRPVVEALAGR
ncbi:MAG TPA: DUF5700 domain-containing putative Zn-dependent protease [Allosphingosinicella sp.]|jgi:hypothetical protein